MIHRAFGCEAVMIHDAIGMKILCPSALVAQMDRAAAS